MNNFRFSFFLLLVSFLFTSCFEITEEVSINEDGSGEVVLTINLNESKDNLKAYMQRGEIEGRQMPSKKDINEIIRRIEYTLYEIDDLYNVESTKDFETFIFTFSAGFEKIEALNKAINTIAIELNQTNHPTIIKDNFSVEGNEFKRLFGYPIDITMYDQMSTMEQFVIESAKIVSIYRFNKPVTEYSNTQAKLSPSKKAIMLTNTVAEIAKGEKSMANTITF